MTMRKKISMITDATREGTVEAQAKATALAMRAGDYSPRAKVTAVLAAALLSYATFAAVAFAASGCGSGGAAGKLVGFIDSAASFMMALGGAGALLMFVVGGFFIIVGGSESRVKRGMGMLKNAVIGLVVLASAFFIKEVVLQFVSGATTGKQPNCVNRGGQGIR